MPVVPSSPTAVQLRFTEPVAVPVVADRSLIAAGFTRSVRSNDLDRIDVDVLAIARRRDRHRVGTSYRCTSGWCRSSARPRCLGIDRDRVPPSTEIRILPRLVVRLEGQDEFGRRLEGEACSGTCCIGVVHRVVIGSRAAPGRPAAAVGPGGIRIIVDPHAHAVWADATIWIASTSMYLPSPGVLIITVWLPLSEYIALV